jgi:hypothetical protein
MPQWGASNNAANSVQWAATSLNAPANTANRTALFGNTTVGAFVPNLAAGVVGVSAETAASQGLTAGWNLKLVGTGPIASFSVTAGGTGYANGDVVKVTATGTGSVNASATVTTNATGGIVSLLVSNSGAGFTVTAPTVAIANSTGGTTSGSGATVVATAGGRAGRVSHTTLVAMGTIA